MTIEEYALTRIMSRDYIYMSNEFINEMIELDDKYDSDEEFKKQVKQELEKIDYNKYKHKQTYYK